MRIRSSFWPSHFHLPASLRSTGVTPLLHYYGRSVIWLGTTLRLLRGSCTAQHEHRLNPIQRSLLNVTESSYRSISNHPSLSSGTLPGFFPEAYRTSLFSYPFRNRSVLGFAFQSQARHSDRPNRVRYPTDRQFVSGCSPPRLTARQLPSTIEVRPTPSEDFHLTDSVRSQAHECRHPCRRLNENGSKVPVFQDA